MADGSSIRAKVAQYFVNKKLEELESRDPQIKVDDWTFLHAISQFEYDVDDSGPAHSANEPPELPQIFPSAPRDDISWKHLLEFDRARRNPPRDGRRLSISPPWSRVAIIGAGVAGLRTAMLLQSMGIPYEIFEASDRIGGRLYTYQFASRPPGNPQGKHDYYDVGCMRFPDNDVNKRTFELFRELGLSTKMIEYVFSRDNNIRFYNSQC